LKEFIEDEAMDDEEYLASLLDEGILGET